MKLRRSDMNSLSNRQKILLLVFQNLKNNKKLDPIQIQKAIFLIEKECIENKNFAKTFNFVPYNYGPFDKDIYNDLQTLIQKNFVASEWNGNIKQYKTTEDTALFDYSNELVTHYGETFIDNVKNITDFVSNLSFDELLNWLYNKYPEMAEKTVYNKKK